MALLSMLSTTAQRSIALNKTKPLIAIVDDDESVCRAVRRLVRSLAMDAETFSSGQEFLDLLEAMPSFQPGCVILDVQMPGMNGLEVQDRLAASGHGLPIVFITAHDEVGVREKALATGAVAFLRKPFDDELLIKTLNEALKRGVVAP
jgi:FixJ family two-component response regulator